MSRSPLSSTSFSYGRWEVWRPRSGQHSTDAVENWRVKAGAKVDWVSTLTRSPGNIAVHTVVPYLSCIKCHPLLDRSGRVLAVTYTDRHQVEIITEQYVQEWAAANPQYELIEYWPCTGRDGTLSIMICYKLTYLSMQDCLGQGPDVRTATANAARRLLERGHCMIRLN